MACAKVWPWGIPKESGGILSFYLEVGDPHLMVGDMPRRCVESSGGMHVSVAMWNPEGERGDIDFLPRRLVIRHSWWGGVLVHRRIESSRGMHESVAMWNPEGERGDIDFLPRRPVIRHSWWGVLVRRCVESSSHARSVATWNPEGERGDIDFLLGGR